MVKKKETLAEKLSKDIMQIVAVSNKVRLKILIALFISDVLDKKKKIGKAEGEKWK